MQHRARQYFPSSPPDGFDCGLRQTLRRSAPDFHGCVGYVSRCMRALISTTGASDWSRRIPESHPGSYEPSMATRPREPIPQRCRPVAAPSRSQNLPLTQSRTRDDLEVEGRSRFVPWKPYQAQSWACAVGRISTQEHGKNLWERLV